MISLADHELVERHLAGDEAAFELLVGRYAAPVFAFISWFSGLEAADVDDLTQEVFVKVWKNMRSFDRGRSFKPWLFAIARTTAIDRLRARRNRAVNFSALEGGKGEMLSFEETVPDPEPLPDEIFQRRELAAEMVSVLARISPLDRSIILLHHIEEMTFQEIAEAEEMPLNTVKSRYRRALARLRELLISPAAS